ncbi:MAG: ferritin-like domain-containing protein [Pseudomonadota bacterium]
MYTIQNEDRITLYNVITSKSDLYNHLQVALGLEIAVLPPYLLGYYSIKDKNSEAAGIMLSVIMEEMLHMALNCNLINAIGEKVVIDRTVVPHHYPSEIPYHAPDKHGNPYAIHMQPVSREVARDLYMLIETPSPFVRGGRSEPQGDNWDTLGQFYQAILEGFENVDRSIPDLFSGDPQMQYHISSVYNGGGYLYKVGNLQEAVHAIRENQMQTQGKRNNPYEPYGINGAQELGHYYRFQEIADGKVALGEVYPVKADLRLSDMEGTTRQMAELFSQAYTLLLKSLEEVFNTPADYERFNGVSRMIMNFVMNPLADILVRTPIDGGVHAGPVFDFDLDYGRITAESRFGYIDVMIDNCKMIVESTPRQEAKHATMKKVLHVLTMIRGAIADEHNWNLVAGHSGVGCPH